MEGIKDPIKSTTGYMNPKVSITATTLAIVAYIFIESIIWDNYDQMEHWVFVTQLLISGPLAILIPPFFGNYKREIVFSGHTLQLEEKRTLFSLMPERSVKFNWSDVIAWQESSVWFDWVSEDPFSIDILVHENGEQKIYRTWGIDIRYQGKKIRFDEYKERIQPFLEALPNDPGLFNDLHRHNKGWSYLFLFLGVLFTVSTIFLFAIMVNGGRIVPELGFFGMAGIIFLGISKKLAKPKELE